MAFRIVEDDLTGPEIADLLSFHLAEMHRNSPACSVHAMPIQRLREADVTFWSAWEGKRLAGCGALKQLSPDHGELKSMRTAPDFVRRGVGEAVLGRLTDEAKRRGYQRLSLETGSSVPFDPAVALYTKHGFVSCGPFAGYGEDPFSRFMTRLL